MDATDLIEDCDELLYLLEDASRKLRQFLTEISRTKSHLLPETFVRQTGLTKYMLNEYAKQRKTVILTKKRLNHEADPSTLLDQSRKTRESTYEFLRTNQTLLGSLLTSTDWQSPSFLHTTRSQAGRETGRIYATINDYKRDQHWDANRFEQAFLKEYIDGLVKFPVHIHATSSGMAAFTTIVNFLIGEGKIKRGVLIGTSSYFENKSVARQLFGTKYHEIDDDDTGKLINAIKTVNPSVIILDSLTNSPTIQTPDIITTLQFLVKHAQEETYLVVDNTGLAAMLQLLPYLLGRRSPVRLIVFESLNKYHQFGMDRVTGGIMWGYGKGTDKLFDYRVHLGTNIPDMAAASLPTPNRKRLVARFLRHQRNAATLSTHLQRFIATHPNSPFAGISFPGRGSYFTVAFRKPFATVAVYKRFVGAAIHTAKQNGVPLVSGTSFGFNTTRIYLTAMRSTPNTPFVRISVGTEDAEAFEAVKQSLEETFKNFR